MKIGPKYKICRRLGDTVFDKCQTPKFQISKAKKVGKKRTFRRTKTVFGSQLMEKQKVRMSYYVSEKQLSNYVKDAKEKEILAPAAALYRSLETRLDNVVYRVGLAKTRALARQIVSHGHITVNDRRVNVPSFKLSKDDRIGIRAGSRGKALFTDVKEIMKTARQFSWLKVDSTKLEITILGRPEIEKRDESYLDFSSVVEFYSRV